jgi:hypothetical protein
MIRIASESDHLVVYNNEVRIPLIRTLVLLVQAGNGISALYITYNDNGTGIHGTETFPLEELIFDIYIREYSIIGSGRNVQIRYMGQQLGRISSLQLNVNADNVIASLHFEIESPIGIRTYEGAPILGMKSESILVSPPPVSKTANKGRYDLLKKRGENAI